MITHKQVQHLLNLNSKITEFPLSEIDAALSVLLNQLAKDIGSQNVVWVAGYRIRKVDKSIDPMMGWIPAKYVNLFSNKSFEERIYEVQKRLTAGVVDLSTVAMVERSGRHRAHLCHELVDDKIWYDSWMYNEFFAPYDIHERLVGACALGPQAESFLTFDRGKGDRSFTAQERDYLRLAMEVFQTFFGQLMRTYGFQGTRMPLTAREREVTKLLLTDKYEKEIASTLGLTTRTTHQYVTDIYRKFGVSGRAGLMASWLHYRRPSSNGWEEQDI